MRLEMRLGERRGVDARESVSCEEFSGVE